MTQAEIELELSGLRQEFALANADDEARRRKARLLARGNLFVAAMFLAFSFVLYLNDDRMYLAAFLSALTLFFLGSNVLALAAPRTAGQ